MIDKITLIKTGLTPSEKVELIEHNRLKTNTKGDAVFYDNMQIKNIDPDAKGVYIRIESERLKLECSLHKYFNETITESEPKARQNYNSFTMTQARETLFQLLTDKNILIDNVNVYYYEIGLNLPLSKDCRTYMDIMKAVGIKGHERELIPHQRYKDKREKTSLFHKDIKKYYKVYDKVFEMIDRKKEPPSDIGNVLRIETVNRRLSNQSAALFFEQKNLNRLKEQFLRDWQTLQFDKLIIVPKGTNLQKIELCKKILANGAENVLKQEREKTQNGTISKKAFRTIREFINNDWGTFKTTIRVEQSETEKEYRAVLLWIMK